MLRATNKMNACVDGTVSPPLRAVKGQREYRKRTVDCQLRVDVIY
jgi:hypothetical protein